MLHIMHLWSSWLSMASISYNITPLSTHIHYPQWMLALTLLDWIKCDTFFHSISSINLQYAWNKMVSSADCCSFPTLHHLHLHFSFSQQPHCLLSSEPVADITPLCTHTRHTAPTSHWGQVSSHYHGPEEGFNDTDTGNTGFSLTKNLL